MNAAIFKDIFAGIIGLVAVLGLAYISVLELQQGKAFTEPGSLTAIAIASVSYFYQRLVSETATTSQQRSTDTMKQAMNGSSTSETSKTLS